MRFALFPLGDAALVVEFDNRIDPQIHGEVMQLFHELSQTSYSFITDLVPAYHTLAVFYNPLLFTPREEETIFDQVALIIEAAAAKAEKTVTGKAQTVRIPVCYDPSMAPDLETMAAGKGLSREEIIQLHTGRIYDVYMLGFLPGFPYMGKVDEQLVTPRHATPRQKVEAGSVGIAGEQTGIYPLSSPGGWQIIGRTPIHLFEPTAQQPVYLKPGDQVEFYSISADEFARY